MENKNVAGKVCNPCAGGEAAKNPTGSTGGYGELKARIHTLHKQSSQTAQSTPFLPAKRHNRQPQEGEERREGGEEGRWEGFEEEEGNKSFTASQVFRAGIKQCSLLWTSYN